MGDEPSVNGEVIDNLKAYRALDNPIRLRMFTHVQGSPDLSFNAIAKKLDLESGHAAYHISVLKAADLVAVNYEREGKAISQYRLTDRGIKIFGQLFSPHVAAPVKRAAGATNTSRKVLPR